MDRIKSRYPVGRSGVVDANKLAYILLLVFPLLLELVEATVRLIAGSGTADGSSKIWLELGFSEKWRGKTDGGGDGGLSEPAGGCPVWALEVSSAKASQNAL